MARHPAPVYDARFMRITPTQAAEWLDRTAAAIERGDFRQRTLNQRQVDLVTRIILEGRWDPRNAETFKIGPDGEVVDGQHRLRAIVAAGKAVEALVCFGVPLETFATINVGKGRSPADIGRIAGLPNATVAMSAASMLVSYQTRTSQTISTVLSEPVPKDLALEMAQTDELLPDIVAETRAHFRATLFPVTSTIAFAWRVAAGLNRGEAAAFFRAVGAGEGLHRGDPALALRERLMEMKLSSGKQRSSGYAKRHEVVWLCLRAFRAHRKDEKLNRMQLPSGRLEFPRAR